MENRDIPNGWRETTLGEIVELKTGRLNSNAAVEGGQYPFFTCSPTTFKINDYAFDTEALLLAGNNANAIYTLKYYKGKFNAYQRTYVITIPNEKIADYKYLYYRLNLKLNYLKDISQGSATKFLTVVILREMQLTLPPYEEQLAIGQVLSSLDEKIELLEEENKTLETLAQTIFTEWFVNFNFPGATGEMEDNELGEIPKGWRIVELRELFSFVKGKKPKVTSEEFLDDYLPQILIDTFDGGKPCYGFNDKVVLAAEDDLLMVMDGASSGRIEFGHSGIVGSTLALLKIENDIKSVVYFFLKQKESDIKANTTGSAIPHTDKERVYRYKITYSDEVIQELEIVLSSFRKKIILNRKQIQTLKITRDTLLPKLTTGEVRVEGFGE